MRGGDAVELRQVALRVVAIGERMEVDEEERQLGLDAAFLAHQIGMLRERPARDADQRFEGRVLEELAEHGAGAARLLVARRLGGVGLGERLVGGEHLVHARRFARRATSRSRRRRRR